ncbi:N-6 DNA methylase [Streptomyces mobaraensis]|uniref:N-6 DNA methylase n=1 Tax=Streptomyces mobaraensis TaxID=35621 RepID=UPI0033340B04
MTAFASHDSTAFGGVWRALDGLCAVTTQEHAYQLAFQVIFLRQWPAPDGAALARCPGPTGPVLARAWASLGLAKHIGPGVQRTAPRRLYGEADRSLAALIAEVDRLVEPAGLFDACLDRHSLRFGVGGDYYTPRPLARLVAGMAAPQAGERVLDPVCGSGRLLIAADQWARMHGREAGVLRLHGRDIRPEARRIAVMNLMLNGLRYDLGESTVDSLRAGPANLSADIVLANPPMNAKDWGHVELSQDPRWRLGPPPKGNADFAWVQHILNELSPQGRAVVLLPDSATRRLNTAESSIRRRLVESDLLAGVVALPARLFPHTRTGATLWLFSRDKSANARWGRNARVGEVLFADARQLSTYCDESGRRLAEEGIDSICRTFANWRGIPSAPGDSTAEGGSWCRSVRQDEIVRREYDLSPGCYVRTPAVGFEPVTSEKCRRRAKDMLYGHFDHAKDVTCLLRRVLTTESGERVTE